jgi:hypothetical protein
MDSSHVGCAGGVSPETDSDMDEVPHRQVAPTRPPGTRSYQTRMAPRRTMQRTLPGRAPRLQSLKSIWDRARPASQSGLGGTPRASPRASQRPGTCAACCVCVCTHASCVCVCLHARTWARLACAHTQGAVPQHKQLRGPGAGRESVRLHTHSASSIVAKAHGGVLGRDTAPPPVTA